MDLANPILLAPCKIRNITCRAWSRGATTLPSRFLLPRSRLRAVCRAHRPQLRPPLEVQNRRRRNSLRLPRSAAENIEAAVDYLRGTRSASVGSIHVNVIRPFPEAAIVAALKGKKNVIILERTTKLFPATIRWAATFARVFQSCSICRRSAFDFARRGSQDLRRSYGLGSRDFRPEHIIGAFEFAAAGRARKDGKTLRTAVSFRPRRRPPLRGHRDETRLCCPKVQ